MIRKSKHVYKTTDEIFEKLKMIRLCLKSKSYDETIDELVDIGSERLGISKLKTVVKNEK